jgi:hypothetical protein
MSQIQVMTKWRQRDELLPMFVRHRAFLRASAHCSSAARVTG